MTRFARRRSKSVSLSGGWASNEQGSMDAAAGAPLSSLIKKSTKEKDKDKKKRTESWIADGQEVEEPVKSGVAERKKSRKSTSRGRNSVVFKKQEYTRTEEVRSCEEKSDLLVTPLFSPSSLRCFLTSRAPRRRRFA